MTPVHYTRRNNQDWLPSIFNEFFDDDLWRVSPAKQFASPAVNILENETNYQVEIAAPGMTKGDFNVRVENDNELVISLEKKDDKKDEGKKNYLRREFSYMSYHQTFIIPEEVEVSHIAATMSDGVLTITLPKKEEVTRTPISRQIEID